nr:putative pectinesterase/pectinesterase inhibitor 12 [Quercus suber]
MDMGVPTWISKKLKSRTRILESDFDPSKVLTVAADGTGNFTTITDAINFAPNNSNDKTHIYVKQGLYEENVEIPSYKTHIVLLGDGADITTITGKRSVGDGWTTFRSATLAMSGDGFLARDICIESRAGAKKHQAVALRVNANFAALHKCHINGYQDTLMPMSGQFTVITAQSRDSPDEDIEISIQNCSILATNDLYSNSGSVKSYIGRPLRVYS